MRALALAAATYLFAGCALTDVAVAVPDDVIVAEVQVVLTLAPDTDEVTMTAVALLHRTHHPEGAPSLSGAVVEVSAGPGRVVRLWRQPSVWHCIVRNPLSPYVPTFMFTRDVACFRVEVTPAPFTPGETLSLRITAPDGRVLTGVSRIPGVFTLVGLEHEDGRCRLDPGTNHRFRWTQAGNVWTHVAGARFEGIAGPLARRGISAPDTVYLLGLATGRQDTAIAFPRDFGVVNDFFSRSSESRKIIRELRKGLPDGSSATVAIAAADRNWVNWTWARGVVNPSGWVRIPSVFGGGTGVFATATRRRSRPSSPGPNSPTASDAAPTTARPPSPPSPTTATTSKNASHSTKPGSPPNIQPWRRPTPPPEPPSTASSVP